jgi:type IV pilus assembly protein PilN
MTTINLYQQSSEDSQKKKKLKLVSGGFIYSIGMLLLVLVALGAMKIYNASLAKRDAAIQNEIAQKITSFSGQDEVDQVADIQSRLSVIKKNMDSQPQLADQLHNFANYVVSGVMVSSYKQEGQKLTVEFLANAFTDVSRQILNLKKSNNFSNVDVTSLTRGEKNLDFVITMDIVAPAKSAQ